jgi:hypothetical protein
MKMENNVVNIQEVKIKLTNQDVFNLSVPNNPIGMSLDKIKRASVVSGKLQYWMFRLQEQINNIRAGVETMRLTFIKEYATKDEKNEPIILPNNQYSLTDERLVEFQKVFAEMMEVENELLFSKIKISSDVLEKMNRLEYKDSATAPVADLRNIIDLDDMVRLEKIVYFVE